MNDDGGRAQRKLLEELQGRAKQARLELEEVETEGFSEQLAQLTEDVASSEKDAGLIERDARATAQRLGVVRHEVEEAERQLLVPKTVAKVSPAVTMMTLGLGVAAVWGMFQLFNLPYLNEPWFRAAALGCGLVPAPILAWLWRRRLSGGATFRSRS